jgi:hypothetical protein
MTFFMYSINKVGKASPSGHPNRPLTLVSYSCITEIVFISSSAVGYQTFHTPAAGLRAEVDAMNDDFGRFGSRHWLRELLRNIM